MKQTIQMVLAFLIPFSLAVVLALLNDYFFLPEECTPKKEVCFGVSDAPQPLAESSYQFLIGGLFLISLILPPFITRRTYQSKIGEINSKTIFK